MVPEDFCGHTGAEKMKKTFCMEIFVFGDDKRALVIPEIGINHEGSLLVAKEMVSAAYRARRTAD